MGSVWLVGGEAGVVVGGSTRSRSTNETRALLEPLLRARGITRVTDLTNLDVVGIPVYSAIRPDASTLVASTGKGLDHDSAWISAVMESLEVAAAESFEAWGRVRARADTLGLDYDIRSLSLHPMSVVGERTTLDWTPALDLRTHATTMVPVDAVGLRGWSEERWLPATFVTTTNGLAAGNDPVEAAVSALLELVERDALGRCTPTRRQQLDPDDLGERVTRIVGRVRAVGAVLSIEILRGVPGTSTCICYLSQPEMPHLFGGTGCHAELQVAAERAILEAVQSRLSLISGLRDDLHASAFESRPLALALPDEARRKLELSPRAVASTLRAQLDDLVECVMGYTGAPVMAVDLAPPTAPFPAVVQIFAPGLYAAPIAPRPRAPAAER